MHCRAGVASDLSPMKVVRGVVCNGRHHQEITVGMHLS